MRSRGSSGMKSHARWRGTPRVQRTKRPTAWRKKSSVAVVVANTPTRRRGMSTPSETMRTATSHGSLPAANAAMPADAPGSSEVTTRAVAPKRVRRSDRRSRARAPGRSRSRARRRRAARRAPPSAARAPRAAPSAATRRRARARCAAAGRRAPRRGGRRRSPSGRSRSGADHSMWPFVRREVDRPHDAPVGERVAVAVLEVGHGLVAVVRDERDRARVGAERRAREREPAARLAERLLDRSAPRAVVGRVVQLVEHDERVAGEPATGASRSTRPAGRS